MNEYLAAIENLEISMAELFESDEFESVEEKHKAVFLLRRHKGFVIRYYYSDLFRASISRSGLGALLLKMKNDNSRKRCFWPHNLDVHGENGVIYVTLNKIVVGKWDQINPETFLERIGLNKENFLEFHIVASILASETFQGLINENFFLNEVLPSILTKGVYNPGANTMAHSILMSAKKEEKYGKMDKVA